MMALSTLHSLCGLCVRVTVRLVSLSVVLTAIECCGSLLLGALLHGHCRRVWCVPALRVPLVHSQINHFRRLPPTPRVVFVL